MMINLRPAYSDDYAFALNLYIEAIRPLTSAWIEWVDADQKAQFASLWRSDHTRIIVLDGREDIGWVEFRQTGDEFFLKQLYISQSIAARDWLTDHAAAERSTKTAKSMALFVLKNNPAFRFYQRHGFEIVPETHTTLVMRRKLAHAA